MLSVGFHILTTYAKFSTCFSLQTLNASLPLQMFMVFCFLQGSSLIQIKEVKEFLFLRIERSFASRFLMVALGFNRLSC